MIQTFESAFSLHIYALLEQNHALGFPYISGEATLKNFDTFCMNNFPDESMLTKEISLKWAERRQSENTTSFLNRLIPVRKLKHI